jgi:hypothetical protein
MVMLLDISVCLHVNLTILVFSAKICFARCRVSE